MTKTTAVALAREVLAAIGRGHFSLWKQFKDVDVCIAVVKDFNASPGSTGAACAALNPGIDYEGILFLESRADWMNNIMDKAAFAIIAGSDDETDEAIRGDLQKYSSRSSRKDGHSSSASRMTTATMRTFCLNSPSHKAASSAMAAKQRHAWQLAAPILKFKNFAIGNWQHNGRQAATSHFLETCRWKKILAFILADTWASIRAPGLT
jgi:hypothetical protein